MANHSFRQPFVILGAGSWGTALAIHLSRDGQKVHLWSHDAQAIEKMQKSRINETYLPSFPFPPSLHLFSDLKKAVENSSDIMLVTPSIAFREMLQSLKPLIKSDTRISWGTKGLDSQSAQFFSQVVEKILGPRPMAILSGPSFAKEVAADLPTAVVIASNQKTYAQELTQRFLHNNFRAYSSCDLIGVQLGGATKNVIAIAVGISDGLGYGTNARCALITRGLAEIKRLGVAMGGQAETFFGLSGLGDLVLTCTDAQSRNLRFGRLLGQGIEISAAQKSIGQIVEGVHSVKQILMLSRQYKIEMPICFQVDRLIDKKVLPLDAVNELFARDPKEEND